MAYVNVAEWKTDQVCEWLKGLDNSVLPYVHSFTNNKVSGQQLLSLRPEDLEQLGVLKLGHQEIILEAVEYLRNFHYELDRENLQLLALRLSCQAHSLHNELSRQTDSKPVTTQTLSDVVGVVTAVKPLVRWLDRPPFSGQLEYNDRKTQLLKLSIEMATCAQRDRFAEKPIEEIRTTCGELAKLADYIIQDIADPMILQPASLDLATLKKRPGDDLGFYILPSFHGTHQIAEIKFSSIAHQCGKMEEGDEIVQVNYQTVVGWERKNVLELFNESPTEVLLTLKRRPRHTKVYGQIYIKPYRLPSNKKTPYATRWQHNLPSPRPELLTIPDFTMPLPRHIPKDPSPEPASIISTVSMLDTMATDSSDSDSEIEPPLSVRLYASKPRSLVQRRATITGASPTTKHAVDIEQFWKELKQEHSTTFQLRDKAASCAHGLDTVPSNLRPQTCLGIEQTKRKKKFDDERKTIECELSDIKNTSNISNNVDCIGEINSNSVEIIENISSDNDNSIIDKSNNSCDTTVPLLCKYDDNDDNNSTVTDKSDTIEKQIEKHNRRDRGKLDKSYSTPAYDLKDLMPVEIIENSNPTNLMIDTNSIKVFETDTNNLMNNLEIEKPPDNIEIIDDINMEGSVAQKINFIEEKFREKNTKELRTNVINGVTHKDDASANEFDKEDQSHKMHDINETLKKKMSLLSEIEKSSDNFHTSSRESSEEKSESTGSYKEGIYSSSSEGDALTPLFKFQHTLVLAENNKTSEINTKVASKSSEINGTDKIHSGYDSKESLSSQITMPPSTFHRGDTKCDENRIECTTAPIRRVIDLADVTISDSMKKVETKTRLTPPEPPPRKYFTKPSPLNLNIKPPEPPERPKVPERMEIRKEIHRIDNRSNSKTIVQSHQRESFEAYREFVEKSTDFIDEPNTPVNERRTLIDHFGYSEIDKYDRQLMRDDKPIIERYEPFTEKFGNGSALIIQNQTTEIAIPRSTGDSPDGAGCSTQQSQTQEFKRTLEKDKHSEKGVVNRAMMVARSIGLHGASKLSSGSPRSNRKRNILLAKRRNVSVKDIGIGDFEGWLTYRSRGARGAWARSWFILKGSSLYRFKNQESIKADSLIVLPGFTASQATEVKSRKYAFKVYHTGTVFYFAADTEDSLVIWLDSINKATFGADSHNRTSGLFSETDESDNESKAKIKNTNLESKTNSDRTFGSLKKLGRKDSGTKDHDIGGASLDRKYLRFLGTRTQNVPVPTAQFRSYRRVLPSSTPNKKPESVSNSPDLRVTVAGSTFYGLTASHSATDVPTTTQDMADYRQTTDRRSQSSRSRRPDDLRGFVTLEEFMLSHQHDDRQSSISNRSASPRSTPITNDHVHLPYRQYDDNNIVYGPNRGFNSEFANNGMIYGHPRNGEETPNVNRSVHSYTKNPGRSTPDRSDGIYGRSENVNFDESHERPHSLTRTQWEQSSRYGRRLQEDIVYYAPKLGSSSHWQNVSNELTSEQQQQRVHTSFNGRSDISHFRRDALVTPNMSRIRRNENSNNREFYNEEVPVQPPPRIFIRDNGYSGSSGDLTCCTSGTLQRVKKEVSVSRKGSFNLNDRYRGEDKSWMDSLRRSDKKLGSAQKSKLKNVAQYQPPPIPSSPFEQDGMRAAFEMHLDKGEQVQKPSRLKSLFGSRSPQKSTNNLDLSKEQEKTLLGSPRLHRALFRDRSSSQRQRTPPTTTLTTATRSGSQSPGDSGISQSLSSYSGISQSHTLSQSFSSVSSVSDWSPDTPPINSERQTIAHGHKRNIRNLMNPPTLPYIPPPSSPPPDDYPGLEYPPVFEPGTYSLSDASLLRGRSNKAQNEQG